MITFNTIKKFVLTAICLILTAHSAYLQTVTVDLNTSLQTWQGAEASAEAGHAYNPFTDAYSYPSSQFANYYSTLRPMIVDAGLRRVRLEIRVDDVHAGGSYEWSSPHSDAIQPSTASAGQWHFDRLSNAMDSFVTNWRNDLAAQGESLWVNICIVDFRNNGYKLEDDANEFAFFVNKVVDWFYDTYGYLPNSLEVLEPDNSSGNQNWTAAKLANGIVAANTLLVSNGYSGIKWTVPSVTTLANVNTWIADMKTAQAGITSLVSEYSYHLYGGSDSDLATLRTTALADGKTTAMLESHAGFGGANADYQRFYKDMTTGYGSTWQQYVVTFPWSGGISDDGGQYFTVNTSTWAVAEGSRTKQLKQYFKYMRRGCVVKGVTNSNSNYKGLPCRNPNGSVVVPIWQNGTGNVTVAGLPAGTYGRTYALDNGTTGSFSNVTISAGQDVTCQLASAGVCTIWDTNYATSVRFFFGSAPSAP